MKYPGKKYIEIGTFIFDCSGKKVFPKFFGI